MTRAEKARELWNMIHSRAEGYSPCKCDQCLTIRFALETYEDGLQLRRDVDAMRSRETQEGAR